MIHRRLQNNIKVFEQVSFDVRKVQKIFFSGAKFVGVISTLQTFLGAEKKQ